LKPNVDDTCRPESPAATAAIVIVDPHVSCAINEEVVVVVVGQGVVGL